MVWNWDTCNWEALANNLRNNQSVGIKITCNLPQDDAAKKKLFIALIRGGVPICLWTRCSTLTNLEKEFKEIFSGELKSLAELNDLFASVWKIRQRAHEKQEEDKQNYLGYHLGFLCDNPDRIPFNLMEQNQLLVETGQ
jgi:hypothetical protein